MSNEYTITESYTSPKTNTADHENFATTLGLEAYGLAPDVVEAKATLMVKKDDGSMRFTVVDFNREREVQLQVSSRGINEHVYHQLSSSFDKMVESMKPAAIEDK